jgi:soluble lytic murein transglycosylase
LDAWHTAQRAGPVLGVAASIEEVLSVVRAELSLGRPTRARTILERYSAHDAADPAVAALLGAAEYQSGAFARAGGHFAAAARAAGRASELRRGVLHARAAASFERAGETALARAHFDSAARDLPEIAGWLAVHQARLASEPVRAFQLLRLAPPAARGAAARVRGEVYAGAGDTASAIRAFAEARDWDRAAVLALAIGDTAVARSYVFEGLASADPALVGRCVELAVAAVPPIATAERLRLAEALRRRDPAGAARYGREAVAAGDSSAATLRRVAELERDAGRRAEALALYARAARDTSPDAALAAYAHGRLLVDMGRAQEGYAALERLARERPRAAQAPNALSLVADAWRRAGRRTAADSLLVVIDAEWPRTEAASRARSQLASAALEGGDAAAAERWYRREFEIGGVDRHAARYALARLLEGAGRSDEARQELERVARMDSLGYYGVLARGALGMHLPAVDGQPAGPPPESIRLVFERLDLLTAAFLTSDADALVRYLIQSRESPDELLYVAEGLVRRGWVSEGVSLGWRVAGTLTLNDPRVLRVVFPWPYRELIEREATEYGVDAYLLAALIRQESTFRPHVVSRAGARGLMQLMPATAAQVARRLGVEWDESWLGVADANLHLGVAHLAALLRQYRALPHALAAYNAGGRPVARWLRAATADDDVTFVDSITYPETRGYVRAVLRNVALYRALYPPRDEEAASR